VHASGDRSRSGYQIIAADSRHRSRGPKTIVKKSQRIRALFHQSGTVIENWSSPHKSSASSGAFLPHWSCLFWIMENRNGKRGRRRD
jgi:hypothetical protein